VQSEHHCTMQYTKLLDRLQEVYKSEKPGPEGARKPNREKSAIAQKRGICYPGNILSWVYIR